jgi:RNA polymerase sigma-70 factor (ECF subfamily)
MRRFRTERKGVGCEQIQFYEWRGRYTVRRKLVSKIHKGAAAIGSFPISLREDEMTLVAAAERGRNQAFEKLVGRYQGRILRVVLRFTRNRADAEDVVQQSFQKAFVQLRQFHGDSSFSTWMTRIAINEALMLLRRKRARPEVTIDELRPADETARPLDFPDPGLSPEESCLRRERKRMLFAAMNELTPGVGTAIRLRELEELSTEETARKMGLSVGAVKARVFHGRKRLRERLKHFAGPAWIAKEA